MATHSSVLAWRIPGTGQPGGLPSMESHRVGHDWSYLAVAAAVFLSIPSPYQTHSLIGVFALAVPSACWACPDLYLAGWLLLSFKSQLRYLVTRLGKAPWSSSSPQFFFITGPFIAFITIWYILYTYKLHESLRLISHFQPYILESSKVSGRNSYTETFTELCTGGKEMNMIKCHCWKSEGESVSHLVVSNSL